MTEVSLVLGDLCTLTGAADAFTPASRQSRQAGAGSTPTPAGIRNSRPGEVAVLFCLLDTRFP